MKYSNIISDFTWSYSRIKQFDMCPYAFFLNYIKHTEKKPMFFASYGSFIHKLLERYLNGELSKEDLPMEYLCNFCSEVKGKAPNQKIFQNYFDQGLAYLRNFSLKYEPISVEKRVEFSLNGHNFVGFIDFLAKRGDEIIVLDHKSRALKKRSLRKKPTKSDQELDEYLRQLYLYSIPVHEELGEYPTRLEFNCFRTGEIISEPFNQEALEEAKNWAISNIERITENEDWSPKIDFWKCRYLCDYCDECEYFRMNQN